MFAILRKLVILGVVSLGSIAFWETTDLRSHLELPRGTAQPVPAPNPAGTDGQNGSWLATAPAGQRLLVWAFFVLLTPVITAPVAGRVLAKQSNAANVLLVFGYTAMAVLTAYVVRGVNVTGILSAIGYLIGLLAIFSYNLSVLAFLARLRKH